MNENRKNSAPEIDDLESLKAAEEHVSSDKFDREFYENFTLVGRFSEEHGESEETMKELSQLLESNGIECKLIKKLISSKLKGNHHEFEVYTTKTGAHAAAQIIDKIYQ